MNVNLMTLAFGLLAIGGCFALILILRGLYLWVTAPKTRITTLKSDPGIGDDLANVVAPSRPKGVVGQVDVAFEEMIRNSGVELNPEQALGMIALMGTLLAAALFFWRGELWLTALGLVLGSLGTLGIFYYLRNRKRRQLQEQLPDTFFLLARSLRAGLTLEQAIGLTARQGMRPLADEFAVCSRQLELGLTMPAALTAMAGRLRSVDFDAFVSTVSLYQSTGGNLPELLDRLAASTRDRNQFRNYFMSATALGRSTAVFMGVAGPALLLAYAIFQPDFSRAFFSSTLGITTFVIVMALEVIGVLWLYRLLSIEY